jgi:hypothetical protein
VSPKVYNKKNKAKKMLTHPLFVPFLKNKEERNIRNIPKTQRIKKKRKKLHT